MHQESTTGTAPALPHHLSIRFTGSGSEYFRIWIVNLLLTVVTLTLYLPWAKVRRLQYFHGNTLVGDAPLGFHGNPRRMLRGYLLVAVLFVLYSLAGQFSETAGLVALGIVTLVSPALWRAGLQFRLANTSWRGLRLRFTGGLGEAYAPMWPLLPLIASGFALFMLVEHYRQRPSAYWLLGVLLALVALQAYAVAWMSWRTKKYQHDHYALGALQTRFSARVPQFVGLLLRCVGVMALLVVLIGGLLMLLPVGQLFQGLSRRWIPVLATALVMLAMLLLFTALKPYLVTRMQNLVWNRTGSEALRFHSALRFRAVLALTLKNWLLIVVTLGLYWPFAAIAMARLRLQAMSLSLREDPAAITDQLRSAHNEAAGEAAGDLFGLDAGL